ncbi:MAG: hypothetical protein JOY58_00885 [Solirubrobacterales bacterium]|nr:hypothetical protein [Solirubrobacterales bacterium]
MSSELTRRLRAGCVAAAVMVIATWAFAAAPPTASANPLCTAAGMVSGVAGKACDLAAHARKVVTVGKKLLGGHVGSAVSSAFGGGGGNGGGNTADAATAGAGAGGASVSTAIGLAGIGAWILGGAKFALHETATVLGQTTTPQLRSTWFSSTYWRMTAIAAVLTLPFLFAAAIQALLRSDLMLLGQAAFCYLPVAMLAVSIAAPLTMLVLAASDELSAFVASAAGQAGVRFLDRGAVVLGGVTVITGSPFIAFLVGVLTAGAALVLWLELLMREAAIYVIVLMLPVVFSAFVWPARRIWAIRSLEVLLALVLSKFAIVAVLSLGGAALAGSSLHAVTEALAGIVLLAMGAFAPWALLRLVPLAELASGAAGALRAETRAGMLNSTKGARSAAEESDARWGNDWAAWMMSGMRRHAGETVDENGSGAGHSNGETAAEMSAQSGANGTNVSGGTSGTGPSEGPGGAGEISDSEPGTPRADGANADGASAGGASMDAGSASGTRAGETSPGNGRAGGRFASARGAGREEAAGPASSSPASPAPGPRPASSSDAAAPDDINPVFRARGGSLDISLGGDPRARPVGGGGPPTEGGEAGATPVAETDAAPVAGADAATPGDDRDPRPPEQPPEDGRL